MREYIRRNTRRLLGGRQATIDTIEPGSIAVTPRKPIDLYDEAAITEVIDLAARIGALLLDSGTGAIDTRDQVAFVANMYGLHDVDVDVTFNTILVCARRGSVLPPITAARTVHHRSHDFTRLAQTDRLVRRIRQLAISPATAHRLVDDIARAPHPYPYWVATIGWGFLAFGIAVYLGGTLLVASTALVTAAALVSVNRWLARRRVPMFFQQIVGGFLAVMPAALLNWLLHDVDFSPSQIIAAGIVVLMAGLTLVGSVQDAITGAPITSMARFTEVLVMTGGVLIGVAVAIRFLGLFGIYLPELTTVAPFGAGSLPARITGGAIAALAFALGSYAERRALPAAFLAGAIGAGVAASLSIWVMGPVFSCAVAAVVVGLVGGVAARRAVTPPLIIAIAGITPLMPGSAIYRGMYGLLNGEIGAGSAEMATALAISIALAGGVTLGEFFARTLHRPRLPRRLRPERHSRRITG
ncbi:MAG: threonine/serine exporter family protein [Gordonia sp. (in: high G+C Gram-positive bacteria)]|uniref:threonine/serine ThrE exporter family protein n=1 Tax=Gordonia sp. (in: high G+C Gram-positive bacteria) TaxID=84139 RepID=UPI0039E34031